MDVITELNATIRELRRTKPAHPLAKAEAQHQHEALYLLRAIWASLPNGRIKDDAKAEFIERAIGGAPTHEHLALATPTHRMTRLSEDKRISIEEAQNYRCALCGRLLDKEAEPNVDHIIPLALGGIDEIGNFQLLCRKCNQGKSASLHWLMIAPFFEEPAGNEPSYRMRYAALQRYAGCCGVPDCPATSRTDQLEVLQYTPIQNGGRNIFDNLMVMCKSHETDFALRLQENARSKMKAGAAFKFM